MAVLGFPSCDSGSYTTPNVKDLLDKRRESFSLRFTKRIMRRRRAPTDEKGLYW